MRIEQLLCREVQTTDEIRKLNDESMTNASSCITMHFQNFPSASTRGVRWRRFHAVLFYWAQVPG
jgi:hypothetical protein